MIKEYLLEDLQRLFEKTRTQALRFAQVQGWTVEKKKIGKVYKNVYKASEIDAYISSLVEVKEEKEKRQQQLMNSLVGINELQMQDLSFV